MDESDEIGTLPGKSQLTLHIEAITNAVRDAGLKVARRRRHLHRGPALAGDARRGARRRAAVHGRDDGGRLLVHHHGGPRGRSRSTTASATSPSSRHGESGRSGVGVTPRRDTALTGQFEFPYGFGGAPTYFGLITTRHMHEYGTTLEQWAQVAVSTRKWAALNPKARNRDPLTVKDVLDSRPVV